MHNIALCLEGIYRTQIVWLGFLPGMRMSVSGYLQCQKIYHIRTTDISFQML
jgi:hypothetical protein